MNTTEIKTSIKNLLNETSDQKILLTVHKILSIQQNQEDWWEIITQQERDAIEEGLMQLDKGDKIAHSEVMKELRERYT